MSKQFTRPLLALPLLALLAGGAFAQTENSSGGDSAAGATEGTGAAAGSDDTGGSDATIGSQGVWSAATGNALFAEGYSELRSPEEAQQRWTSLTEEERNTVKSDCQRYRDDASTPMPTVDTAMDAISTTNMTALCAMVDAF
jgi:hypothetical protein